MGAVVIRRQQTTCTNRSPPRQLAPVQLQLGDTSDGSGGADKAPSISARLPRGAPVPEALVNAINPAWPNDYVICSDLFKFCYIKQAKSASTTMSKSILPDLCTAEAAEAAAAIEVMGSLQTAPSSPSSPSTQRRKPPKRTALGCPPVFDGGCHPNAHEMLQRPDYFIFSIVRNPISRARSSYYYLRDHRRGEAYPPLDAFCNAPTSLQGKHEGSVAHWQPQFQHLISANGTMLPDYVGKVEDLQTSVANIVKGINANLDRQNSNAPRLRISNVRLDAHDNPTQSHDDRVDVFSCECTMKLSSYFWADFDMLQYTAPPCRPYLSPPPLA